MSGTNTLDMTRRTFLKASAGTSAAAMAAPSVLHAMELDLGGKDYSPETYEEREAIHTVCHVCNIQDGAIAYKENGRVVKFEGSPDHPSTRGRLCAKGNAGMWHSYDPDRILYPLKRTGKRGEGKWKRVTWDEALSEVADKVSQVLDNGHPNEIMLKWGRNRTGGVLTRFMHTLGSATILNHTSVCESSKKVGMEPTWGPGIETPDFANTKYVLNFGSNILESAYFHNPLAQRVTEGAAENKMKMITFDTRLSNTAGYSDEWIPVFPGTDGAVALAIGHVILDEDLQDSEFIDDWTNVTVDELKKHYLENNDFSPEWAEGLSGVPADTIRRIAREFATTTPATTYTYRGPAKHLYGSYQQKACMMLSIMCGQIEKKGGYCLPRGMGYGQPQPEPPAPEEGSVLAHPPEFPFASHKVSHLVPFWIDEGRQNIQVYFDYMDNPAYSNPGDDAVWGELFRDENLIPFFVKLTPYMSEGAQLADVILPDVPYLERWEPESMPSSLWPWLGVRQPVIDKLGEGRETKDYMQEIIHRVDPDGQRGMRKYWEFDGPEDYVRQQFANVPGLKEEGGLEYLKENGFWPHYGKLNPATGKIADKTGREIDAEYGLHKKELSSSDMQGATVDENGIIHKNGKAIGVRREGRNYVGFSTPDRLINVRVHQWAKAGFNPMPTFKQVPWHKDLADDEMILGTHKYNVHTQSRSMALKWLAEIAHANWAPVNTETAKKIGIGHGDLIRVESDVGYIVTRAYVTEGVHPKMTVIGHGMGKWGTGRLATLELNRKAGRFGAEDDPDLNNVWWEDKGVNPNIIIPPTADPIGGSQGYYDVVVKIKPAKSGDKYGDRESSWDKHKEWYKKTMKYTYVGDYHLEMHPEMSDWGGPDSVDSDELGGGGH